jgi:hypothetical protein
VPLAEVMRFGLHVVRVRDRITSRKGFESDITQQGNTNFIQTNKQTNNENVTTYNARGEDLPPPSPPGEFSGAELFKVWIDVHTRELVVWSEPRTIVRPTCPPEELLGQSYSTSR